MQIQISHSEVDLVLGDYHGTFIQLCWIFVNAPLPKLRSIYSRVSFERYIVREDATLLGGLSGDRVIWMIYGNVSVS